MIPFDKEFDDDLDATSSPRPDTIHPLFAKSSESVLCNLSLDLYKNSLLMSIYSTDWELTYIKPSQRGGNSLDVNN